MTNRENYRRTFGALHVSEERLREVYHMNKHINLTRIGRAVLVAACIMALLTVSAFAANEVTDGKVLEKITVFVNGVMGSYTPNGDGSYTFKGEDGQDIILTYVDGSEDEMVTEDGEIYYSETYSFEFDGEEVHQMEVQLDGDVAAESAYAVEVSP